MHGRGSSLASRIVRIVGVAVLVSGLSAQVSEVRRRVGLLEDWSHHHLKFNTAALRQHPELASREPRAAFQLYREAQAALARISSSSMQAAGTVSQAQHGDWSALLGTGRLAAGQYPAKFTGNPFTPVTAANCTTDFVVFGLNVAGSVGSACTQANLIGLNNLSRIGMGSTDAAAVPLYGGDFDNTYFSTPASGHMLVCGTAAATTIPTLYSLSFDRFAHLLSATPLAAVSTDAAARCGPITEFFNSNIASGTDGTDFFFFGVSANCTPGTGVANGCIMSRGTTGGVTTTAAVFSRTGTSGIIPDNNSIAANASSIYFTNQGGPNTAYKLTQQGLN